LAEALRQWCQEQFQVPNSKFQVVRWMLVICKLQRLEFLFGIFGTRKNPTFW